MNISKLSQNIANQMVLCQYSFFNSLYNGNHCNAIKASKEFAKLAVNNFEIAQNLPSVPSIPVFSKLGLNLVIHKIIDIFRPLSKEEKLLRKMVRDYRKALYY